MLDLHHLWDPVIFTSASVMVRKLRGEEEALFPILINPFCSGHTVEDIKEHDRMLGLEVLMMRLSVYFQNRHRSFMRPEDVYFGLDPDTRIAIASQAWNETGPYLNNGKNKKSRKMYPPAFIQKLAELFNRA
jgi:hypothetical protein